MRLFLLTSLTMVAFAANSVLNRMALETGGIGPASFAALRLISGAVMLGALVAWRDYSRASQATGQPRAAQFSQMRAAKAWHGPLSLLVYVLGFSFAYLSLDTGVGALILFGGVQITMFAGAIVMAEDIPARRWAGALLAFAGLVWLMWPRQDVQTDGTGMALMLGAAIGWGLYSLNGRGAVDPLKSTAGNFALAAPVGLLVWALLPDAVSWQGAGLAVVSGVVTSGLGYALWYTVLPRLPAAVAAVAQLSVPVIAMVGGLAFLGEAPDSRFGIAAAFVMAGVFMSVIRPRRASL